MEAPIYQVDAFARSVFTGNPAAVCPLEEWLSDELMQGIALENNLSETAFLVRKGERYGLRWFTPSTEVDLCGHATMASAHVVFEELGHEGHEVVFDSMSGELRVTRDGDRLVMDFPARPGVPCDPPHTLLEALGGPAPIEVLHAPYWLVAYEDEATVRALAPDMGVLAGFEPVIVTAPGTEADFISRFFAPNCGIDEDPVTGSAHCTSAPYWAKLLGKNRLSARQISPRGGEIDCEVLGDRVLIGGRAVMYLRGTIQV